MSGGSTQARARSQDTTITQQTRTEECAADRPLMLFPFCVIGMIHPENRGALHEMASPKPVDTNTFLGFLSRPANWISHSNMRRMVA